MTVTDQLHVEERQGAQEEHEEVGDEEGAPAILVAQVREPVCAQGGDGMVRRHGIVNFMGQCHEIFCFRFFS
jgi:hypothetical protein